MPSSGRAPSRTASSLDLLQPSPATRNVVLPDTLPVTRPLCRLIRSVASVRPSASYVPVSTNVLPVRQSLWPLGIGCAQGRQLMSLYQDMRHDAVETAHIMLTWRPRYA